MLDEKQGAEREASNPTEGHAPAEAVPVARGPATSLGQRLRQKRKLLLGVIGALVLVAAVAFAAPSILRSFNTVSTDDAYVNGHVTFVAPRVGGQISRVLVDNNNRVRKGELIAELDKEPYQVAVSEKTAAVDTANADLQAAIAKVRGIEAEARSRRWNLQHAVQEVDNQIALLHARVAALDKNKAALTLAQVQFDRAKELVAKNVVSRDEYDQRQAQLTTANAGVAEAQAEVYQVRVSLGLPAQPQKGDDLGQVPADLDETFAAVLQAQADLIQNAALLGVIHSYDQSPKEMIAEFEKLGDIDKTFTQVTAEAPDVKQAEAKLESAKRDLAQAELNLRYCDVVADIDGVITSRNVNPGDYVQVGQNLMAIRSLSEIWVDANFKETQLGDLRIGQPVDLYVDMYGDRRVFKGRVAGFTNGTGSSLALLPAENATGNFIKVVQRLPVRIELEGYDPNSSPLFVGTSVTPYVYTNKTPTGPDAGKFLQAYVPQPQNTGAPQESSSADK